MNHKSRNEIIECHINPHSAEERRKIVTNKLEEIINL